MYKNPIIANPTSNTKINIIELFLKKPKTKEIFSIQSINSYVDVDVEDFSVVSLSSFKFNASVVRRSKVVSIVAIC